MLFSVIIPYRGSVDCLERCVASVPDEEEIEVIVVDNNEQGLNAGYFAGRKNITLLYSEPEGGAGRARNQGVSRASGKWLLFADADDFFLPGAFEIFTAYRDTEADIVYFALDSCDSDSLKPAHRGDYVTEVVSRYRAGEVEAENRLRYKVVGPCGKMVRAALVRRYGLVFEERKAANDIWFSVQSGFYAEKVMAVNCPVYCVTCMEGSITTRKSMDYLRSVYLARIRVNVFLKEKGLGRYQMPLFVHFWKARKYGWKYMFQFAALAWKNKVNLFTGWQRGYRWFKWEK